MAEVRKSQRGANLTQADRERGGRASAAKQVRDARGKFAGSKGSKRADETGQQSEEKAAAGHHGTSHHHGNQR